jgi:hypothetical protein
MSTIEAHRAQDASPVAGLSALAVLVLFVVNMTTWFAMLDWDTKSSDPDTFLTHVVHHVGLWRLSQVADFLSYVAIVPLVVVMWDRAGRRGVAAATATIGGLSFAVVGGAGAVALLGLWGHLFVVHGSPASLEVFRASWYVVPRAIWNCFDAFVLGIWLVWAGDLARRHGGRTGVLGIATGVFALADSIGFMAGLESFAIVAQIAFGIGLAVWLGCVARRELLVT